MLESVGPSSQRESKARAILSDMPVSAAPSSGLRVNEAGSVSRFRISYPVAMVRVNGFSRKGYSEREPITRVDGSRVRCGAVCPDTFLSVLMFGICPPFRSFTRKREVWTQPGRSVGLFVLFTNYFLATFAAQRPPEFTHIWSERSPVERILINPMAALLNIRADCGLPDRKSVV